MRTSVSPGHGSVQEEPASSAAWHGVTDEADIDFHFGMHAGDAQPTTRVSVDVDLTRPPGRPKAAPNWRLASYPRKNLDKMAWAEMLISTLSFPNATMGHCLAGP